MASQNNNRGKSRKSIRLPNRDYSGTGWYFVTICTRDRLCHFGEIINGQMQLSPSGKIAQKFWSEIPQHSQYTSLDVYIIMPNHIHGIIIIDRPNPINDESNCGDIADHCRDVACNVPTGDRSHIMSEMSPKAGSLSAVIRSYKSAVTRWCKQNGQDNFAWQTRFYEHIIRNDGSCDRIREYIVNNPLKWSEDKNNPMNFRSTK